MSILLKKIHHREQDCIGIFFPYDAKLKTQLKDMGAIYSKTFGCYYLPYQKKYYLLLKQKFPNLQIENPTRKMPVETREIASTALEKSELQSGEAQSSHNPEHTVRNLIRLENIGKYWRFSLRYHSQITPQLNRVKGVFWHREQKCYYALRHPKVKFAVEEILNQPEFFGTDFWKENLPPKGKLIFSPNDQDRKYMQVQADDFSIIDFIKRIAYARYSKAHHAYILPATPAIYDTLMLYAQEGKVSMTNLLPEDYLNPKNMPNMKALRLQRERQQLLEQILGKEQALLEEYINMLQAKNYSHNTIRTYGSAFTQFLREFHDKDLTDLKASELTKYISGLMERGLSATTGNTLVNAINFYYRF